MRKLLTLIFITLSVIPFSAFALTYGEVLPSSDTKALYHFDGNANDSSGNGANGSASGPTLANGRFGQGYQWSSSGSNGNLISATIPSLGQTYTLMAWINYGGTAANGSILGILNFTAGGSTQNSRVILYDSGTGTYHLYADDSGAGSNAGASTATITPKTWYFIAVTKTGSNGTLTYYINGAKDSTWTASSDNPQTALTIGNVYNNANGFVGTLDEIQIRNRVMTATEIQRYYTQSRGRYAPSMN